VEATLDHAQAALAAARGAGLAVERREFVTVASNVLWSAGGPLRSDWEDAHLGPRRWDLGCLLAASRRRGDDSGWAEAALAAHGGPCDAQPLDACVDARVAQGAAYLAATGRGDPGGHLEWLGVRAS
jgi:aminoglycoside phosphotransferase (APT) family kinase protein